jgi:hypothetical protein
MNFFSRIKAELTDPLKTFRLFEISIAVVCIAIPLLLRLADREVTGFRTSISDYVYMKNSYVYGMLLTIAAMLFIFNGAVYFKKQKAFGLNSAGKWYNVILGLSLFGVILLPHKEYVTVHYFFGGVFFLGNAVVIALFHKKQYAAPSLVLAFITVAAMALHFFGGVLSLLVAEWISLTVIGLHFILEATGTINYNAIRQGAA